MSRDNKNEEGREDLYGPLMLALTLMAILVVGMKMHSVQVREGTLIGTAFFTSSSYWIGTSLFYYTFAYLFSANVSVVEVFSKVGYSFFGFSLTLLSLLFHLPHLIGSYLFFFSFGFLSSLRLTSFLAGRTGKKYFLPLSLLVFLTHLFLLLLLANLYAAPFLLPNQPSPLSSLNEAPNAPNSLKNSNTPNTKSLPPKDGKSQKLDLQKQKEVLPLKGKEIRTSEGKEKMVESNVKKEEGNDKLKNKVKEILPIETKKKEKMKDPKESKDFVDSKDTQGLKEIKDLKEIQESRKKGGVEGKNGVGKKEGEGNKQAKDGEGNKKSEKTKMKSKKEVSPKP